ncbi:hypothetical protein [Fructilactobacillus florum]|uniref:Uncharacterized protein n=1 Tax=Fructilactobacillus florum DSM 22689 = JCM 16035 TaxID=1423745 RepID=A0A0R2CIW8_9LACO|nr:hypothetical protein [Fructilactobacillus florum]KRM91597.1 hypothetical protein FC87_GL000729 [Fructilactobacillus florum DSM 22689 = JCM 16035]
MSVIIKRPTNVHLTVSIQQVVKGVGKPAIAILTKGTSTKAKIYSTIDDLSQDYNESTDVFETAKAAFEVPGFNESVEVLQYGSTAALQAPTQSSDNGNVSTSDSNTTALTPVSQIVADHLFDGFNYLVPDKTVPETDLEDLSDFLYDNQRVVLYAQLNSVADLQKLSTHVQSYQKDDKEKQGNTGAIVETSDRKPAVQIVAYASINAPTDLGHVGNLSQMVPDDDLTQSDYEAIDSANGSVVVNKADWAMSNSGKALKGNYIDQFVHVQMVTDEIKRVIQNYLNSQKFPAYDESTVSMIEKLIDGVSKEYTANGILVDPIVVTSTPINQVPDRLVEDREFSKFGFNFKIANDVQDINANVNVIV